MDEVITEKPYPGWVMNIDVTFRTPDYFSSELTIANCGFGFRDGREVKWGDIAQIKDNTKGWVAGNVITFQCQLNWNPNYATTFATKRMQNGLTKFAATTTHELGHGLGINSTLLFDGKYGKGLVQSYTSSVDNEQNFIILKCK